MILQNLCFVCQATFAFRWQQHGRRTRWASKVARGRCGCFCGTGFGRAARCFSTSLMLSHLLHHSPLIFNLCGVLFGDVFQHLSTALVNPVFVLSNIFPYTGGSSSRGGAVDHGDMTVAVKVGVRGGLPLRILWSLLLGGLRPYIQCAACWPMAVCGE